MTGSRQSATATSGFDEIRRSDVVVVGTGAAGLSAVDALVGLRVTVLGKGEIGRDGSSHHAQGGVAAALGAGDSPAAHALDTERVGAGLSDPTAARILTAEGPGRVLDLIDRGAAFDRDAGGELGFGLEAGHRFSRILHAADATGAELMRTLVANVADHGELTRQPGVFAYDLAVQAGRVIGVLALAPNGSRVLHLAPAVVLATGGFGQLYPHTTNPVGATGDGIAMAARAGATLSDMEFVQFHPTALAVDANPRPLLTEALRGAGATLVDARGRRFMTAIHPDAELAPRDVVARAVWEHVQAGEDVFLDARAIFGAAGHHFPTVARLTRAHGLDAGRDPLPVVPAAHYAMGGIWVDALGRTSLRGLWACGECACTGVHGGNRLASNSLLEALVFGRRVGVDVRGALAHGLASPAALVGVGQGDAGRVDRRSVEEHPAAAELRRRAFAGLGIARDAAGLEGAREYFAHELARHRTERSEHANLLLVGLAVAEAALARRESRGAHARRDHPRTDPALRFHSASRLTWHAGAPRLTTRRLDRRALQPQATRAEPALRSEP